MILTYENALLRAIEERDADLLYNMMNDKNIEKMTVASHFPVSKKSQVEWINGLKNNDDCVRLIVDDKNVTINNQYESVGMVILSDINYKCRTANLAFKKYSNGKHPKLMYNGCIALLSYAFNELGLNCINCRTLTYNEKSLRLQERLGFKKEGVLRSRIFKNGSFQDLISSSLLRSEFLY